MKTTRSVADGITPRGTERESLTQLPVHVILRGGRFAVVSLRSRSRDNVFWSSSARLISPRRLLSGRGTANSRRTMGAEWRFSA